MGIQTQKTKQHNNIPMWPESILNNKYKHSNIISEQCLFQKVKTTSMPVFT